MVSCNAGDIIFFAVLIIKFYLLAFNYKKICKPSNVPICVLFVIKVQNTCAKLIVCFLLYDTFYSVYIISASFENNMSNKYSHSQVSHYFKTNTGSNTYVPRLGTYLRSFVIEPNRTECGYVTCGF